MDEFQPLKPVTHFTTYPQWLPGLQLFDLAGVKMQPAQADLATGVTYPGRQLPTRPVTDLRVNNIAFNLDGLTGLHIGNRHNARFVFVA